MNKKFKRLISVILTVMMAIGMMPFSGLTTVSAAMPNTVYFDAKNVTASTPITAKFSGNMQEQSVTMTHESGTIYSASVPSGKTHVMFIGKNGDWYANGSSWPQIPTDGKNMFVSAGNGSNRGYWTTYNSGGGDPTPVTGGLQNVRATFYDYLSDEEINGNKWNTFNDPLNEGNDIRKNWYPFWYLNKAIADKAKTNNWYQAMYFGNFYMNSSDHDSKGNIKSFTGLDADDYGNRYFDTQINNSNYLEGGNKVVTGLVKNKLVNGNLMVTDGLRAPFFDETFLAQKPNGTNQSLGKVFTTEFPLVRRSTSSIGTTLSGATFSGKNTYYQFDSTDGKDNVYFNNVNTGNYGMTYNEGNTHAVWGSGKYFGSENKIGFFPFDKNDTDQVRTHNNANNFCFGVKYDIDFTLPEGATKNGEDIVFTFSGDDDLWVFVDDVLVLDMGGDHNVARGEINFAQKKSYLADKPVNKRDGVSAQVNDFPNLFGNGSQAFDINDPSKVHHMTIFYMERGMIDSNLKIGFSFEPLPTGLFLSKEVDVTEVNEGLAQVVANKDSFDFTVNKNDTAIDGTYTRKRFDGSEQTGVSTEGGKVTLGSNESAYTFKKSGKDLFAVGDKVNITESVSDTALEYDTTWKITDKKSADSPTTGTGLTTGNFNFGTHVEGALFETADYSVDFVNTPKVGTVAVKKAWKGDIPSALENKEFDFKVEVDLSGTGNYYQTYALDYTNDSTSGKTGADGSFKIKPNETVTFEGIPISAKVKVTETSVSDGTWKVDGNPFDEGIVSENANNEGTPTPLSLVITNKTNEITVDKVIYVEAGKETPFEVKDGEDVVKVADTTETTGITTTVNEGGVPSFKASEADKKYEVSYTGSKVDGTSVKGTITVYSFKATDKVYVFDYGLKSDIAKTNTNGDGLFQDGVFYNTEAQKVTTDKTSAYLDTTGFAAKAGATNDQTSIAFKGSANQIVYNTQSQAYELREGNSVIFTPLKFMDKVEEYTYKANIKADSCASDAWDSTNPETGTVVNGTIKVMPASVVYYEDNFNDGTETDDSSVKIVYGDYCTTEGTAVDLTQSNGQTEQYGHDDAYANGVGDSAGSSTAMRADATATFTFKGTGFDIIARTTTETAGIVYQIQDENGRPVKIGAVDTFYANGDLYQIPVIHEEGLTYGKYTVTLGIKANVTGKNVFVYLDGIRVYNPMGVNGDSAYIDEEEGATVSKVSTLILGNGEVTETGIVDAEGKTIKKATIPESKAALLGYDETDGLSALGYTVTEDITTPGDEDAGYSSETQSILQVLHSGPNNEVYLSDGSAVGFVATAGASTDKTLQIEAKIVNTASSTNPVSSSATLQYLNNSKTATDAATISTATAMYYKIPVEDCISLGNNQYLVVLLGNTTEDGLQVLSFSNVKVNGYTLSNPYDNTAAKNHIDTSAIDDESPFVSFGTKLTSIRKNTWTTYQVKVTDACNAQLGDKPFTLYYTNGDTKAKITVTATKNGTNTYNLRFKAPNAVGKFPLELHYVDQSGNESSEYISTTLNVKK